MTLKAHAVYPNPKTDIHDLPNAHAYPVRLVLCFLGRRLLNNLPNAYKYTHSDAHPGAYLEPDPDIHAHANP